MKLLGLNERLWARPPRPARRSVFAPNADGRKGMSQGGEHVDRGQVRHFAGQNGRGSKQPGLRPKPGGTPDDGAAIRAGQQIHVASAACARRSRQIRSRPS